MTATAFGNRCFIPLPSRVWCGFWQSDIADMAVQQDTVSEMLDLLSVSLLAVAAYNTLELLFWIFDFFKRWRGLYFWSILTATLSVGAFTIVVVISTFRDVPPIAAGICIALVYPCMQVTANLVLYSRLHLITKSGILTFTRWLIIVSCIVLYIPYITILIGFSSGDKRFYRAEEVNERYAVAGSICRELFICGVYIYESVKQLKPIMIMKGRTGRKVMVHLILANGAVVALDALMLASLFSHLQHVGQQYNGIGLPFNCASQSVKLKIEFSILNKLLELLGTPMNSLDCGRSPGRLNEQDDSLVDMMREASTGTGPSSGPNSPGIHYREPV